MNPKKLVQDFYKSDAFIDSTIMDLYLHPEFVLEWNSSKGFVKLNKAQLLAMISELSRAYVRSKVKISHIVSEGNTVAVRNSHYVKTIENPREEMLLAHFIAFWEIKDDQLYRGYQMSHID